MKIWRLRVAYWVPKAYSHSHYVILIAVPLQQWLRERSSMLSYKNIAVFFILKQVLNQHKLVSILKNPNFIMYILDFQTFSTLKLKS